MPHRITITKTLIRNLTHEDVHLKGCKSLALKKRKQFKSLLTINHQSNQNQMKRTKIKLWAHAKKTMTLVINFLKTIFFKNMNKKQFYLPFILMIFLFSCKKENDILSPAKIQDAKQVQSAPCGTSEYLEKELMSDQGLKTRMGIIEQDIQMRIASGQQKSITQIITIPVVVHVVYNLAGQNISDAQVLSQIDVLNEDYSRKNADAINTPSVFQPYAANTNIQFVLAKRDPNGNATNGITRTSTTVTSFSPDGSVCYTSYGGVNAWNTTQYLNLWVCNLSGYAGYSATPGASAAVDGVVINYLCFGRTGTLMSSTAKGRTSTHEIGHWFGLIHNWGPSSNCGDDLVGDTPTQEKANSGFPVFPHVSACSSNSNGDMFMGYMDYTDDAARNMFSIGQSSRMNATLYGYRSSLLTSLGGISPTTTTTTTCNVPGGLNATLISQSSATLNWASTGAASYSVRYKPTTSTTWMTTSTASTSLGVSNLSTSTTYEFQVASVCSSTSSSAFSSSVTFTTLASSITTSCNVPAGLSATLVTKSSATLNWSSTGVASYSVRYKPTSSTTWVNASTISTSLAVSGLSSSTIYEFQVASVCSGTTLSSYSASTLFSTLAAHVNRKK